MEKSSYEVKIVANLIEYFTNMSTQVFLTECLDQNLRQFDGEESGQEEDPTGPIILRFRQAWMCE